MRTGHWSGGRWLPASRIRAGTESRLLRLLDYKYQRALPRQAKVELPKAATRSMLGLVVFVNVWYLVGGGVCSNPEFYISEAHALPLNYFPNMLNHLKSGGQREIAQS